MTNFPFDNSLKFPQRSGNLTSPVPNPDIIKGTDGTSAPQVKIQYSHDGTNWTETVESDSVYIHFSTNDGVTYGGALELPTQTTNVAPDPAIYYGQPVYTTELNPDINFNGNPGWTLVSGVTVVGNKMIMTAGGLAAMTYANGEVIDESADYLIEIEIDEACSGLQILDNVTDKNVILNTGYLYKGLNLIRGSYIEAIIGDTVNSIGLKALSGVSISKFSIKAIDSIDFTKKSAPDPSDEYIRILFDGGADITYSFKGKNGVNGVSSPEPIYEYSDDGITGWSSTYASTNRFMRIDITGTGNSFSNAIRLGADGVDGDNAYLYIGYAELSDGTGFSSTYLDTMNYIKVIRSTTEIDITTLTDFGTTGWMRFKGDAGASSYIHFAYADSLAGDNASLTNLDSYQYMAIIATNDPNPPVLTAFDGHYFRRRATVNDYFGAEVLNIQTDNTLVPTTNDGDRYILTNTSSLNVGFVFESPVKDINGNEVVLGDNDIVQYITGSVNKFRIAFDASEGQAIMVTVLEGTDTNYVYFPGVDAWEEFNPVLTHAGLQDIVSGVDQHLTVQNLSKLANPQNGDTKQNADTLHTHSHDELENVVGSSEGYHLSQEQYESYNAGTVDVYSINDNATQAIDCDKNKHIKITLGGIAASIELALANAVTNSCARVFIEVINTLGTPVAISYSGGTLVHIPWQLTSIPASTTAYLLIQSVNVSDVKTFIVYPDLNKFIDIDGALTANSDSKIASQKAIKTYVDNKTITKTRLPKLISTGATLNITADQSKVIHHTVSSGGLLTINVSQTLAVDECVDITVKIINSSGGAITLTITGSYSVNWAGGVILTGLANGDAYHLGLLVNSDGVDIMNFIKNGV